MRKIFIIFCVIFAVAFSFAAPLSSAQNLQNDARAKLEEFRKFQAQEREKLLLEIDSLSKKADMLSQKLSEANEKKFDGEESEKFLALKNSDFVEFRNAALELSKNLKKTGVHTNAPAAANEAFYVEFENLINAADSEIFSNSILNNFVCGKSAAEFLADFEKGSPQKVLADVSLGKFKNFQDRNLLSTIKAGGLFMIPILFFGIFAFFVCIVKILNLAAQKKASESEIKSVFAFLESKDLQTDFPKKLSQKKSSFLRLFREILNRKNFSRAELQDACEFLLAREFEAYSRWTGFLSLTASISPLLGLLGTVSGIIKTFSTLSVFGTSNPQMMSGGISEALITTEFGLIIAIPAYIASAYFVKKAKEFEAKLAGFAEEIILKISK